MEFSLEQIPDVAGQIIARARAPHSLGGPGSDHATLITFSGDLGAGKTTLIKEIAKQLGVSDDLASPTFVIYKKYEIQKSGNQPWAFLIHGDMYRLESANDILKLGWERLLADPQNILCIEWPEKVRSAIPPWAIRVSLAHAGDKRVLDIEG